MYSFMGNILKDKPRMKKVIGLRNIVTNGNEWKYLIFYDVDTPSEADIKAIIDLMEESGISYIIYSTKHGIHVVGLTPLNGVKQAILLNQLQSIVPEYYSGQTIRVSLKEYEKQELIYYNLEYPRLDNLLTMFMKRFPEIKYPDSDIESYYAWINAGMPSEWHCVYEKYWSKKI